MTPPANASVLLRRLQPWLGRAVHARWTLRRSFYQEEADALLLALSRSQGRMPAELALRLEGFLGRLHREWFPSTWRKDPTFAEVLEDFRWWLGVAERWGHAREAPSRRRGSATARRRKPAEPLAKQPRPLLTLLRLPPNCSARRFTTTWRRFLKENHPDLNPGQSPEQRRRFAEAVALWRR